jgi:hypothetical protein
VDGVENRGVGEVAVHGEGARDVLLLDPIDQLLEQVCVVFEGNLAGDALLLFLEAAKLQRVVLTRGTDILDPGENGGARRDPPA